MNEDGSLGCRPSYYSESTLPQIWLDELSCIGFEYNIDECQHNGWGETNCQHKEDAGCICEPISHPAVVPGTLISILRFVFVCLVFNGTFSYIVP